MSEPTLWAVEDGWESPDGDFVTYADHARIVAEAGAAVFAFHPEWTVTGMCDPNCLACRRLTELITEREKGYEEGKAEMEQAHAAALAEAKSEGWEEGHLWRTSAQRAFAPRTLTADDPEPAVGSVVLDQHGRAWQREDGYPLIRWVSSGDVAGFEWAHVAREFGPATLIHDGGAA